MSSKGPAAAGLSARLHGPSATRDGAVSGGRAAADGASSGAAGDFQSLLAGGPGAGAPAPTGTPGGASSESDDFSGTRAAGSSDGDSSGRPAHGRRSRDAAHDAASSSSRPVASPLSPAAAAGAGSAAPNVAGQTGATRTDAAPAAATAAAAGATISRAIQALLNANGIAPDPAAAAAGSPATTTLGSAGTASGSAHRAGSDSTSGAEPPGAAASTGADASGAAATGARPGPSSAATALDAEQQLLAWLSGTSASAAQWNTGGLGSAGAVAESLLSAIQSASPNGSGGSPAQPDSAQAAADTLSVNPGLAANAALALLAPAPHAPAASHAAAATLHAPLGSPAWVEELGAQLTWMAQSGIESASLHVSPAELGPIEVRIAVHGSDASVWFGAAQAGTRAALEHALPQLRQLFASQGLALADAGVFHEPPRESPRRTPAQSLAPVTAVRPEAARGSDGGAAARLGLVDLYA